jgi:hypothetical protein
MTANDHTNSSGENRQELKCHSSQGRPKKRRPTKTKKATKKRAARRKPKRSLPPGREVSKHTRKMVVRMNKEDALNVVLIADGVAPEKLGLIGKVALERKAQALTLLAGLAWNKWATYRPKSQTPTSKAQKRNGQVIVAVLDMKIDAAKDAHVAKMPETAMAVSKVASEFRSLASSLPPLPPPPPPPPPELTHTGKMLRNFERLAASLDSIPRPDIAASLRELRQKFAAGNG